MQSLFGGSKSSASATPLNLQLPAYTGMAPGVAGGFESMFAPGGQYGGSFGLNPFMVGAVPSNSPNNPLAAQLPGPAQNLVNQAGMMGSGNLGGASAAIQRMMQPGYASGLATSPETQAAIAAATNPMISAFNQTALPGLKGQFTAAGHRVGTQASADGTQKGSSAFDAAHANAQNNLVSQVGAVGGGIANQAYQTGLQQQGAAPGMAASLSQVEMQNLTSALQASALPQMIQQYGINAGLELFNKQMETILQALGLAGQISQPAVGYNQKSSGSSSPGMIPSIMGTSGAAGIGKMFGFGI